MKLALLCGGPSAERGISLNSARSVLDHLEGDDIEIVPIYFDHKKNAYKISKAQLYSNTPSDFDFKLHHHATALSEKELIKVLRGCTMVFPVIHGAYGEDGGIQRFLEKNKIPFIGSDARACERAFDKFNANELIKKEGFFTLPSIVLKIFHNDHRKLVEDFFKKNKIKRAIVKPASGGSSIGVFSVTTVDEAVDRAELIFSKRMDTRVVVEPFAEGREFTVIILENRFGLPVAIIPTEIETDYTAHQIFDFRKKYLPTRQVTYHCPPRFDNEMIERVQVQAEQLFKVLGMRDFARFDGWILKDKKIWFSDFNPISGMEQNSFLFQQASRVGLTHANVLRFILQNACRRFSLREPTLFESFSAGQKLEKRKPVNILFGGSTSERQVSLMSGTNAWLKLRRSRLYNPKPFLLDTDGHVWRLPYHLTLNHTVEEITENCKNAAASVARIGFLERKAQMRLGMNKEKNRDDFFLPVKMSFENFMKRSSFVFIGLHGGEGEDGTLQKHLVDRHISFNGPDENVSRLCMDKWKTSQRVGELNIEGVRPVPGAAISTKELFAMKDAQFEGVWEKLRHDCHAKTLIVKPRADGCSSGIVRLYSWQDLKKYAQILKKKLTFIPHHTFRNQTGRIEMPLEHVDSLLFEKFITTDVIRVKHNILKHYKRSGLIEVTVGVVQEINETLRVLNPSLTVAEGQVLSVEEKFQGGTGINITPPPDEIVTAATLKKTKKLIGRLATEIGIKGYSRIDAFMNTQTGELMIIEINTLPALTPSTVLYQQALAQHPAIFPRTLLEKLIQNKGY